MLSIQQSREWLRSVYRRYIPPSSRWKIHLLRHLGLFKFLLYRSLIWRARLTTRASVVDGGVMWSVPQVGLLNLGHHSTPTLRAHWIEHAQPIRELKSFVQLARGRKTLVDAGAAEGLFSLAFCRITTGRAFAFEPSPVMLARLQDNVSRNPSLDVSVQDLALGSANAAVMFREVSDGMWVPTTEHAVDQSDRVTVALDDWCRANGTLPDMIKIDVEGLEIAVLEGAKGVLAATHPAILLELHPGNISDWGPSLNRLDGLMRELRYGMTTLQGGAIEDVPRFVAGSREDTVAVNVVLAPFA